MLKPAILYKNQIIENLKKYYYTTDMLYMSGGIYNWYPDIAECPKEDTFQFAIVDENDDCIGFLGYYIDFYSSNVYNFGIFSFDRGNFLIGKDLFDEMEKLYNRFFRIEWRMISGNPVERSYDAFCNKHNGNKVTLNSVFRDRDGMYHDEIIYEIINESNKEGRG